MDLLRSPRWHSWVVASLGLLSLLLIYQLTFVYEFEQFFPQGDPDLDFYNEFREKFEPDDNFLLIGIPVEDGIFNLDFLTKLDSLTRLCRDLPEVDEVMSLTGFRYFIKAPFGYIDYPAVHLKKPEKLPSDSVRILGDERLMGKMVSEDFRTVVVLLRTSDEMKQDGAEALVNALEDQLPGFGFSNFHLLGRANFQKVLVDLQKREFILSTVVSAILVLLVFFWIFRKPATVVIALVSVLFSMLLFLGFLALVGIELDLMAVLYPILMIIVGVSDVVHIISKYNQELSKGKPPREAMRITKREIGTATLLTSLTTSIGFLTLLTSVVPPVKTFGVASAAGVIIAFLTVFFFTTSLLIQLNVKYVGLQDRKHTFWPSFLERFYLFGKRNQRAIWIGMLGFVVFTAYGLSLISTDVHIDNSLPRGAKVTEDFRFFESRFNGFRPLEMAAIAQNGHSINELEVLQEIDKMEQYLKACPEINGIQSVTMIYKSLNRAENGDRASAYHLPDSERKFSKMEKLISRMPDDGLGIMLSKDKKYGRISATLLDVGTDSIRQLLDQISHYASTEIDTNLITFRQTGTGIILDKNNIYLRDSLVEGLSIAFLAVSFFMALLFRSITMVLISLVPNVLPLLLGGALLGYLGIEVDASTAIIFSIAFGIAVDDTIHFLSKFRFEISEGRELEEAIRNTFHEAGKAIFITTIILFFGFLILLFSSNPATLHVGMLISITLFSAVFADMLVIPLLLRTFWK